MLTILALPIACSNKVETLEYMPEPANIGVYCQRSSGQLTIRPTEEFTIKDDVNGVLTNVVKIKLKKINYREKESKVDFDIKNIVFPVMHQQQDPLDSNTFYFVGATKNGRHIATYRIGILNLTPDAVTLRYAPERCVIPAGRTY